jgi:hypothetical protein
MNKKAIYGSGIGIAVVAIVIILIVMNANSASDSGPTGQQLQIINENALNDAKAVKISVKNITAQPLDDEDVNVRIEFDVYNPNQGTLILEAVTYNLFTNDTRIISGDIGEKLEGFVASQESVYPIIGNGTITLKDTQSFQRNELAADILDRMLEGKGSYLINGTYSYKQTSSFQATGADKDFELTFH